MFTARDATTLVIGIGNDFRQDDGAGLAVARQLRSRARGRIRVMEHGGDGTSLLDAWEGAGLVVLVDAVRSGSSPGTIHHVDVRAEGLLPGPFVWSSSHALGVADAVKLAARLNRLPPALFLYGIEGRRFGLGQGLSPEVKAAAAAVVERLLTSHP
jgi:hydrogenase maturation protease